MTKDKQQLLELVKKLKAARPGYAGTLLEDGTVAYIETLQDVLCNPDGPEAAEAIQSLLVENERLIALVEKRQAGNRARFAAVHSPHPSRR